MKYEIISIVMISAILLVLASCSDECEAGESKCDGDIAMTCSEPEPTDSAFDSMLGEPVNRWHEVDCSEHGQVCVMARDVNTNDTYAKCVDP